MASRWISLIAATMVAVPLLSASTAHAAGPSAKDRETARVLMAEGRTRRTNLDLEGSLQAFRAANAMLRFPTTGLEVARAEAMLGKLVEARETAKRALAEKPIENEPAFERARLDLQAFVAELATRIPTVLIEVEGVAPPAGTTITPDPVVVELDGATLDPSAWTKPLQLNPGRYSVVAHIGNRTARADVSLRESEHQNLPVTFPAPLVPDPSSAQDGADGRAPITLEPGPTKSTFGRFGSPVVLGGAGAAILGTVAGFTAGGIAIANKGAAAGHCVGDLCPPASHGALADAHTWATTSTVAFTVAGVGLVVAATWYFAHLPSNAAPPKTGLVAPGVWAF